MTKHKKMSNQPSIKTTQSGFTLIELMIMVVVVAILAAIAIPTYGDIMVKNAEAKAESKVKQLQLELESWRANTLTFKGFAPKKVDNQGATSYGFDAGNKIVFLPAGKDATNADYKVTVESMDGTSLTGNPDLSNVTAGSNWRMFAEPLADRYKARAYRYYINSRGIRCKSKSVNFSIAKAEEKNCIDTGLETW